MVIERVSARDFMLQERASGRDFTKRERTISSEFTFIGVNYAAGFYVT